MDRKLIDYLPDIMRDYEEIKQITNAEQREMEALWKACDSLLKEAFVQTETEVGAERWEKILDIKPKDTDSLEVRNFRIMGRLVEDLPYTDRVFARQLAALCGEKGYTEELTAEKGLTMKIRVAITAKELKDEVVKLADRVVPANIILDIQLMYNTHRMLKRFTHGQLAAMTHTQVKETVLEE